jgi:hypothetical protein
MSKLKISDAEAKVAAARAAYDRAAKVLEGRALQLALAESSTDEVGLPAP